MIVPIFLPHLGCDRRCIYCDQGYITDVQNGDIRSLIERTLANKYEKVEVGLYGGNIFGVRPADLRVLFARLGGYSEKISNFRISTKPVPLLSETIELLKENSVTVIELGMPIFNDAVLERLNRGHTVDDFYKAFHLLKEQGFKVALQVMVGLPGETVQDIERTAEEIARLSPDYIRIYPLVVLKETPLHLMYEKGSFSPIPFEDSIDRAMHIYVNALKQGIKTVKMGLTDSRTIQSRVVAGHFHPAFGYLVKSRAFYLSTMRAMKISSMKGDVLVKLNDKDIPHLLGHKRDNVWRFGEEGIRIRWEKAETGEGCFELACGQKRVKGTILDARRHLLDAD